jgi:hypothetical protein
MTDPRGPSLGGRPTRSAAWFAVVVLTVASLAGVTSAHAGSLGGAAPVAVPSWLFALTGGAVVVASFLVTSLLTDRDLIRAVDERGPRVRAPSDGVARSSGRRLLAAVGVVGLFAVVVVGLVGPARPLANLAVVLVWVAWWAGYTATVYLLGDTWPAVNPWRTLARALPSLDRTYPTWLGSWPSVAGLLALVWLEVVSPLADAPRLLAAAVVGYSAVTLAGAATVGRRAWFSRVDPVARVFAFYGAIAPVRWDRSGVRLGVPGAGLSAPASSDRPADRPRTDERPVRADGGAAGSLRRGGRVRTLVAGRDDVAFVVALVWTTTFDGVVATPLWRDVARSAVAVGVPPPVVYLGALVGGFVAFVGAYRLASRAARRAAGSYVAVPELERRFAVALLPIAAGYHLAHFLGYFLSLSPTLLAVLASPFAAVSPVVAVLPPWFGGVQVACVVVGHLVGVWVAHGVAFETFTGRLQPLRSQYPYVVVMAAYTMTSVWLLMQPYAAPPFR